ncbi:MAG TPA: ATP-binding cassette domain-containing protein, partial [Plasticicumulans sp.]|nr:ATP-binding cassette domain-containing protein [Plasticicumulans sp.]
MPSDWKAEPAGLLPLGFEAACYAVGKRTLLGPIDCVLDSTPGVHLVLGPNGAGKSLFLRLAHGLLQPTGGQVRWATEAAACRQRQAMVFQHPVVLRRPVRANVEYALGLRGLARAERHRR